MINIDTKIGVDPRLPNNPAPTATYLERLNWRLTEVLREHAQAINGQDVWEDLSFQAAGINPAGAADAASYDTTTYPGTLLFAGNLDNHIAGVAQMPHAWAEGTAIRPHIHWTKTTADAGGLAVDWKMRFAVVNIGAVVPAMSTFANGTLTVGNLTTAERHNLTSFGDLAMTGATVSACVIWELVRYGSTDAYNSSARLLAVDFHYQRNTSGSRIETAK
jgi:hypothetical protein